MREPSSVKANKGTLTHKALELLARKKLATQLGEARFNDDETGLEWDTASFTPEEAHEVAWDYYTKKFDHHAWKPADYRDCRKWMFDAMAYNGGLFNPLQREVIWPEKYFDFTIDAPWARYSYVLPDGRKLEGQLAIRGTMDLVCRVDEDHECIEMVDWKTGLRKDWASGKIKDYAKLREDPQLRIYHYALSRLCPWAREIIVSIVFIRDGGPFSLPYGREDLEETEKMLERRFNTIRDCQRPRLIYPDWKCTKLCHFGKNEWEPGCGTTICRHIKNELTELGMDRVVAKYGNLAAMSEYEGGGRSQAPEVGK